MFRKWNWLIFLCLFITCLTITGIWMRRDNQPEPITSTTTTTKEIEWTEENLNLLIEKIAKEEHFEDTYLLKRLVELESQ